MKILAKNNECAISHKAYFKQNELFNTLYKNATKSEKLAENAKFFKEKVANHEIEIVGLQASSTFNLCICEIVNNVTKKVKNILTSSDSERLLGILAHLNLYRDSDFFSIDNKKEDIDCLDILTKKV